MAKKQLFSLCVATLLGLVSCSGPVNSSSSSASSSASSSSSKTSSSSSSSATSSTSSTTSSSSTSIAATEVPVVAGWVDNGDSVYTPAVASGKLTMSFDKSGVTWAAAKKSLGAVQEDLANMKKLVMTIKLNNYAGSGPKAILMKIEFANATDHPAKEAKFQITDTEATYEWDLSDQVLTDALQILMFVDPGCGLTSGDVVFTKLQFEKAAMSTSGVTIVPVVTDYGKNTYATGDTFSALTKWHDGGDFAYKVTEEAAATKFDYLKWGNSYSSALTTVNNVSGFSYLNITAAGPSAKTALFKVEGGEKAIEGTVAFKGDATAVNATLDLRTANIAENADARVLLFAEPGSETASNGTITVSKIEFSNTPLVEEKKANVISANPWDTEAAFDHFYDGGDAKFEEDATTPNKFSWSGQPVEQSWSSISAAMAGNLDIFAGVKLNVTVSAATKMLFKAEGKEFGVEKEVTFGADTLTQDILLDLSAKTVAEVGTITKVLIFPLSSATPLAAGTLTINSAKMVSPRPLAVSNGAEVLFGPSKFVFTRTAGSGALITWTGKGEWDGVGMHLDPSVDYSAYTKLSVTVAAKTDCAKLKFKVNDSQEYDVTTIGTDTLPKTYTLNITTAINAAAKPFITIFLNPGVAGNGSLTITNITLAK